ncbi:hypothetical protein [Ferrovibrio terrae]|uniref:hypothetical protein n=1 Tax=Ferrovibrio terrae TaxID=2594003 RepID=UPI003137F13F
MPFQRDTPPELQPVLAPVWQSPDPDPQPGFGALVGAAFRRENTIGSAITGIREGAGQSAAAPNRDYDPFARLEDRYARYADAFVEANSDDDVAVIKRRIDAEESDRRLLAAGGGSAVAAQLLAGLADPINLIPVGGVAFRGARLGASVARGAASTARAGALGAAAAEGVLQATQETRTAAESVESVGAGTLLAGMLGGAAPLAVAGFRKLRGPGGMRQAADDAARQLETEITPRPAGQPDPLVEPGGVRISADELQQDLAAARAEALRAPLSDEMNPAGAPGGGGSLSAASAADGVLDERLKSALGVEKAIKWTTPLLRLSTSPSIKARQVLQQVAETPLAYDKNALGVATPIAAETLVKLSQWPLADSIVDLERQWLSHRGLAGKSKFATETGDLVRGLPEGHLTWREFKEQVGAAMRRGDTHEIPQVAAAAQKLRQGVFEPWKNEAIKHGLLPADVSVETAQSYFSRVYDIERIKARRPEFTRTVADWLEGEQKTKAEIQRQVRDLDQERDDLIRLFDKAEAKIGRRAARQQDLAVRADEAKRAQGVAVQRGFDLGARRDEIRAALDDLANQKKLPDSLRKPDRQPVSLLEWVRVTGGLREEGGELLAMGARLRPGLINNKAGRHFDDVARDAWENGYFSDLTERPTVNQFLDAMRDELGGRKIYTQADQGLAAQWQNYASLREQVEQAGIDPRGMDDVKLGQALERAPAKAMAADLGLDLGDDVADELVARSRETGQPIEDLVDDHVERAAIQWYEEEYRAKGGDKRNAEPIPFEPSEFPEGAAAQFPDRPAQAGQDPDGGAAARGGGGSRNAGGSQGGGPETGRGAGAADGEAAGRSAAAERRRLDDNLRRQRIRGAEADFQGRRLGARVQGLYDNLSGIENDLAALQRYRDDLGARLEGNADALDQLVQSWPGKSDTPEAILKAATGLERAELEDLADQIADHILRTPGGRSPYEAVPLVRRVGDPAARGPMKARAFNIPDQLIEPFLISDAEKVAQQYVRTMAPDVALKRALGSIDGKEWLEEIRQDYRVLLREAKTEAQRQSLERQSARDVNDAEALIARLRGTYGAPADPDSMFVRVARGVRDWNYLRMMGMMATSAIPDMGRPVMVHGFQRVFGSGLKPLISDFKSYRLAADEVKRASAGLDMVLDTRAMNIADIGDDYGRQTKFERGLKAAADKFGVVALMAPWNAAMRQFAGIVTSQAVIDAVQGMKAGKADAKTIERLASGGIDAGRAQMIAQQLAEHAETRGDLVLANTERWTDRGAVESFRAAIIKDVDRIIVTPGIGDRPLWMSSEMGKMIGQFRSFAFASTQKVALSGLQQRDMAALNGVALMTGLGALTYGVQGVAAGREISNKPAVWIAEGIDRAGWTGWLYDVNNIMEKATRGQIGMNRLAGGEPSSRYASRNLAGAVLGPSIGTLADMGQIIGSAASFDWQESDSRALRRMVPTQNLFYLRRLYDQAEAGINASLGVPQ